MDVRAAIGWALYSIYLFYWKTNLQIFQRFTLVALFGAISLLPFYIVEEVFIERTFFDSDFFAWVIFAAISPGIIAFTLYTVAQKNLEHLLLVLPYISLLFMQQFMAIFYSMRN